MALLANAISNGKEILIPYLPGMFDQQKYPACGKENQVHRLDKTPFDKYGFASRLEPVPESKGPKRKIATLKLSLASCSK